jgi:steroid 5-alpha reductase family enzyme
VEVLVPAAVIAATMLLVWLLSLVLSDVSVVDPVWGPAFGLVAVAVALTRHAPHTGVWLVLAITLIWGVRLGVHLGRRKLGEPEEDRRYAQMRRAHPSRFWLYSLGAVFVTQGFAVACVALPIEFLPSHHAGVSWLVAPGLALWLLGFGFESVGDEQLRRFKADPHSAGTVMDRGLWRYTRHPNYFGDACVWWGIWLVALSAGTPWWTAPGPLVMIWLLARGSGKPTLERDIAERRPDYASYIERTSGFIPLPPRSRDQPRRAGGRAGAAGSG